LRLSINILLYLTLFYFTLPCHGKARLTSAAQDVAEERARMTTRTTTEDTRAPQVHRAERRKSTETMSAYKTTEFVVYVLAVLGVLIASMIVDQSFGADPAWRYVTYLTVGYMISRGLAKAGSREPYRD
jgi:Flp pilus assembly protein TadG